jgi:DNA-binding MarR family transcriptional regulator
MSEGSVITPPQASLPQLETFFTEVSALANRLKRAPSADLPGALPPAMRIVLQILKREGPLSVPQIARLRFTSRQNIQLMVNKLKGEECVSLAQNPAHKRSELVQLTDRGEALLEGATKNEAAALDLVLAEINGPELTAATQLLRTLRKAMLDAGETQRKPIARTKARAMVPALAQTVKASEPEENELPVSLL